MNNRAYTILRTAAGSPPSVSGFQYLRKMGNRVIAADCEDYSVGFCFADAAYIVPRADSPDYLDALLEICQSEKVDLFLPSLDEELLLVSRNRPAFDKIKTRVVISSPETLELCVDKYHTYLAFMQHGIPAIPTQLATGDRERNPFAFPVVIKPRQGRGSSGVYIANNVKEWEFFRHYVADAIVQPLIPGVEYTVDILADMNSDLKIASPRKRLATDSGISSKGVTAWHPVMIEQIEKIVKCFQLIGPANIQCFLTENKELFFSEINARLAGTGILSIAAGVPLYEAVIALAKGEPIKEHRVPVDELVMLRYWSETYFPPGQRTGRKP